MKTEKIEFVFALAVTLTMGVCAKDATDGLVGWWRVEQKPNGTALVASDFRDHVHAGSSEGDEANTYDVLDGGWYHVSVPDNGKSNTIIITVDPHYDAKPRQARIDLQAGNAFTSITIYQQ